ncbi:MOSC domain-containing protein [Desulfomarina sp.]
MNTIKAISISDRKGMRKKNVNSSTLIENFGLENDAHGGKWHRQVSFLAQESINFMREKGLDVVAGNFAENITTEGINLVELQVGSHLNMGECEIIISQLGKICHNRCAIYHQAGDCVMPREGIFGIVNRGGRISVGDTISIPGRISATAALLATDSDEKEFGEDLRRIIIEKKAPAFIRFDSLNDKNRDQAQILTDLTETQKIDDIILFDPSGSYGLTLTGFEKTDPQKNVYRKNSSTLHLCSNADELFL